MSHRYDPELEQLVPLLPTLGLEDVTAARAAMEELVEAASTGLERDESGLEIEDRVVAGYAGSPDVGVRIFQPLPVASGRPALLHIHGGGFVVGSVATEHVGASMLASNLGAVVVSVDYRLAPEHPFPAALHDCYAALTWVHDAAEDLGIDTRRVVVYGQSAGGGLAAALALFARDHGGPSICFQFLGIPELDDRLDTPSMQAFSDTPLWNRPNAELSWRYYLGEPRGPEVSQYAAPARAADLSGLPPAYVSTMEFDPLRDEGIRYATRLLEAGVSTELHSYPGTFHGSALVVSASVSRRIAAEEIQVLGKALNNLTES